MGRRMSFTVVSPRHDDRHEDGLLRGIANGLAQMFPVLDHPERVLSLMALNPLQADEDDQTNGDELV
jgi:hypothetical protein